MGPKSEDKHRCKGREETQRGRLCGDGGRRWRDAGAAQDTWEGQEGPSLRAREAVRPWDTLISDFQPPDCGRIDFSARGVAICHGHPRTLMKWACGCWAPSRRLTGRTCWACSPLSASSIPRPPGVLVPRTCPREEGDLK